MLELKEVKRKKTRTNEQKTDEQTDAKRKKEKKKRKEEGNVLEEKKKKKSSFLCASFVPVSLSSGVLIIIASVCIQHIYVYFCMNQQMTI